MAPKTLVLLTAAATAVAAALLVPACGRQTEGERCDINAGTEGEDSDCDDGLVCTSKTVLGTNADICCPAQGNPTDAACIPGTLGEGGAGGAGGGATASSSSSSSASSGGSGGGVGGGGGGDGGTGGSVGGGGGS